MADETKIIGKDKLNRKLKMLPDAFRAEAEKVLGAAAQQIVDTMKSLVPVDDGALKESIGWTFGDPPKGSITFFKSRPIRNAMNMRLSIFAGNDKAFYARWVEFGTQPHAVGRGSDVSRGAKKQSGASHPGAIAQPFFYPAWRIHRKKLKSKITRGLNKEAKRIAAL